MKCNIPQELVLIMEALTLLGDKAFLHVISPLLIVSLLLSNVVGGVVSFFVWFLMKVY